MTITLAAVYTPIGIQGGLTGALFREFAFTLAGAVIISGVVALTLSPMMASKLLRAGDTEQGFAGWVNQRFDAVRHGYARSSDGNAAVTGRSSSRSGSIVALLIVPFYMFSQKELAPAEDQSVVFGIVQANANSTLDQTTLFTEAGPRRLPLDSRRPRASSRSRSRRAGSAAWSRSRGASGRGALEQLQQSRPRRAVEDPGHPGRSRSFRRRCRAAETSRSTSSSRRRRSRSSSPSSRTSSSGRRSRAASSCSPTRT